MYSLDLRNTAIRLYFKFGSLRPVADILAVGKSTIHRWLVDSPLVRRVARRKKTTTEVLACVDAIVAKRPFAGLKQIAGAVKRHCGTSLSTSTACRIIRSLGLTRKRTCYVPYIDGAVKEKRLNFSRLLTSLDPATVVSVDETAFQFDMFPYMGYAQKGRRLRAQRRHKAYCRQFSVLAAISNGRVLGWTVVRGSVKTPEFVDFILGLDLDREHVYLQCDNVAFHKTEASKEAMLLRGLEPLFQSSYSPDYNPIELAFGRLKEAFRGLPCTMTPEDKVDTAFRSITPAALSSMFRHCWNTASATLRDG